MTRHQLDGHRKVAQEQHLTLLANTVKQQKETIETLKKPRVCQNFDLAANYLNTEYPHLLPKLKEKLERCRHRFQNGGGAIASHVKEHVKFHHAIIFFVVLMHLYWMPFFIKALVLGGSLFAFKKSVKKGSPSSAMLVVSAATVVAMFGLCHLFFLPLLGAGIYFACKGSCRAKLTKMC